jgi:hypothetical protein
LGNGNKDQQGLLLNHVLQVQQAIVGFQGGIDGPLVKLENIYNTLDKDGSGGRPSNLPIRSLPIRRTHSSSRQSPRRLTPA